MVWELLLFLASPTAYHVVYRDGEFWITPRRHSHEL